MLQVKLSDVITCSYCWTEFHWSFLAFSIFSSHQYSVPASAECKSLCRKASKWKIHATCKTFAITGNSDTRSLWDSAPRLPSCWITSRRAVIGQMPPRHLLDHYVSLSVPKFNDSYLEKTRAVPYSAGFIITVEGYIRASISHFSPLACPLSPSDPTCEDSGTRRFVSRHLSKLPLVAKRRLQKLMSFIDTKGQLHLNLSNGKRGTLLSFI